jgi:HEAT repeat protein
MAGQTMQYRGKWLSVGIAGLVLSLACVPPAARARARSLAPELAQEQEREAERRASEQEQKERDKEQKDREKELKGREKEREKERRDREGELYDDGKEALDEGKWDRAASRFDQVVQMNGRKADAALYWRAYAENKAGRREAALATLQTLRTTFPQSRWLNDAKALEAEIRQNIGQPSRPDEESDCDLKLLALNGLMNRKPEEAVPILEKLLQSSSPCPKLRSQALFVLAQSGSPEARQVLAQVARGEKNPDLQRKAISYLGLFGGKESRQTLADIYASSNDVDAKRVILRSFMVAGERDRLVAAAKGEKDPELRREAIRQLGPMGAREELWQLYQAEPTAEIKEQIIQSLFVSGSADRLIDLAKSEKDSGLRRKAIRSLGLMGASHTSVALTEIYANEKDSDVRKEVINSFFLQGNVKSLIEIARKETDPTLKKAAVSKLSLMNSKEATEFLMELLNK